MCGLAGFNLAPDENVHAHGLAAALLLGIEHRGMDATGVAYFDEDKPVVAKKAVPASRFIRGMGMPKTATNAILHTRWASKGSPSNPANNHPIEVDGIVGVHNGVVRNDDALFARIGNDLRRARVDSEAIFASLTYGREKPTQALARVEGSAAVAWLETYGDPDVLHASRVASSPFVFGYTEAGSFVFASTEDALLDAVAEVGISLSGGPYHLEEGVYVQIRLGEMVHRMRYETANAQDRVLSATERKALNLV